MTIGLKSRYNETMNEPIAPIIRAAVEVLKTVATRTSRVPSIRPSM